MSKRPFTHIAWSFSFNYNQYLNHHKRCGSTDPIVSKERYTKLYAEYNERMEKDLKKVTTREF